MHLSPNSDGFICREHSSARSLYRLAGLIAMLAALSPAGIAQRSSPAHAPARSRPAIRRSSSTTPHSGARRARTSLPFPLFGDSFDFDDPYSSGYPVASDPPPFLLHAVRAMGGSADSMGRPENGRFESEPASNQPLMIELQGGRYVRVKNAAIDGEALPLSFGSQNLGSQNPQLQNLQSQNLFQSDRAPKTSQPAPSNLGQSNRAPLIATGTRAPDLPPAVLVFHDGRTEEVRDYTIADGILYARGDFYTDGYWNKKIDLTTLDLAQTLQANASRNVKFVLPSSPNEVITRP